MDASSPTSVTLNALLLATMAGSLSIALVLLRRAPAQPHLGRRGLALAGALVVLAIAWVSPLATVSQHYLLSAHLVQITLVMGVAPPLLLLALPMHPRVRVPRWLGAFLRACVHPLLAVIAMNAAFFLWHLSGPYDAASGNADAYAAQQLTLFVASVAFWWPIVSPLSPPVRCMPPLVKLGYILLATIPQTFGGLLVALAHHPLYTSYVDAPRLLGLDVMTDQEIAGACIALVSKITLLAAFFVIFMRALQSSGADGDEDDGGGGERGPDRAPRPVPSGTPRWLGDLERGRTVPEPAPLRPLVRAGSESRPA